MHCDTFIIIIVAWMRRLRAMGVASGKSALAPTLHSPPPRPAHSLINIIVINFIIFVFPRSSSIHREVFNCLIFLIVTHTHLSPRCLSNASETPNNGKHSVDQLTHASVWRSWLLTGLFHWCSVFSALHLSTNQRHRTQAPSSISRALTAPARLIIGYAPLTWTVNCLRVLLFQDIRLLHYESRV